MANVAVNFDGVYGSSSLYEGREVVVIYHTVEGWVSEEGVVENGVVEIEGVGPLTNERYYIGIKFSSTMKTFPLRAPGNLNKQSRLSRVDLYLANQCDDLELTIGGEKRSVTKDVEYPDDFDGGKVSVNVGSSYEEEPFIQVIARGMQECNLLAIDAVFRQYER